MEKRHLLTLVLLVLMPFTFFSQLNIWSWVNGSNLGSTSGNYGVQGVSNITNSVPPRSTSASWKDKNGDFWVFGGYSWGGNNTDLLNDLWKYDVNSDTWTWMKGSQFANVSGIYGTKGIASAINEPGGRAEAVTWCDSNGNLWLFSGWGYDAAGTISVLNDLWKYDTGTNQWTWMKGSNLVDQYGTYGTKGVSSPNNMPGARMMATSWTDNNSKLWLFGGAGLPVSGALSDLSDVWVYSISTNEWTWINGQNFIDEPAVPGTKGTSAPANTPGGRRGGEAKCDNNNNAWMFGGFDYAGANSGRLNDLWKYNITTNQWTWISGTLTLDQVSNYGTKGVASPTNCPGSRSIYELLYENNNLWFFGGAGIDSSGWNVGLNDLWKYDIANDHWTWMRGSKHGFQYGNYGAIKTPSVTNEPGCRAGHNAWIDNSGNLWMFGGDGYASTASGNMLNDLWYFSLKTNTGTSANVGNATSFFAYPNPTNSLIKIKSAEATDVIELYTVAGELLHCSMIRNGLEATINVENLANGIYCVLCTTPKCTIMQKIIVQK